MRVRFRLWRSLGYSRVVALLAALRLRWPSVESAPASPDRRDPVIGRDVEREARRRRLADLQRRVPRVRPFGVGE